jgi:hypothetical protein
MLSARLSHRRISVLRNVWRINMREEQFTDKINSWIVRVPMSYHHEILDKNASSVLLVTIVMDVICRDDVHLVQLIG